MSQHQEPILHDRQSVVDTENQLTSSQQFVDINGAQLTAKDLGSPGNYDIDFYPIVAATVSNTIAVFRLLINGIPSFTYGERTLLLKINNTDKAFPVGGFAINVKEGDVFQFQWKTDKGSLNLSQFTMQIDGIPEIRVV